MPPANASDPSCPENSSRSRNSWRHRQTLTALGSATDSQVVNDTKVQSGIEDADIAKVISQFSQTQTALQAAYGTTTRLESKTLFDYLQ